MNNGVDGSLIFDTRVDTDGFKTGADSIKKQADGLTSTFKKLGTVIGTAFAITKLVQFGKEAVGIASDLQEVQNVVDVAFGDMTYKMEEFAKTCLETYGISELTAKQMGSTYMAMGKGMQMSDDIASDMALSLTARAADIASFYNKTSDEANALLKSIYTGETEALKSIGVVMTEANLQAYALANGISKTVSKMSQAEKVQLRYAYVMQQTSLAQGDFVRTSDSWANQTRVLSESFKRFLGIVGVGLVQILLPVVQALALIVTYLSKVGNAISQVFGKKSKNEVEDTSQSVASVATSIEGVGEATKEATKEVKKGLASFDELNVISQDLADNTSNIEPIGVSVDSEGLLPIEMPDIDTNKGNALTRFVDGFAKALSALGKAVAPLALPIAKGFIDFVKTLGGILSSVLGTAVDILAKGLELLGKVVGKIPAPILEALGTALAALVTPLLAIAVKTAIAGIITKIGTSLVGLVKMVKPTPLTAIASAISILVLAISKLSQSEPSDRIAKRLKEITEVRDDVDEATKSLSAFNDTLNNSSIDAEARGEGIQLIADEYFELASRLDTLSEGEVALLKTYANELVTSLPELNQYIDTHTGMYVGTQTAIQGIIDKTKEMYRTEAASASLKQIAEERYKAEMQLNLAKAEQVKMWEEIEKLYYKWYNNKDLEALVDFEEMRAEYNEMSKSMSKLEDEIENLDNQFEYSTKVIKGEVSSTKVAINDAFGNNKDLGKGVLNGLVSNFASAFSTIKSNASASIEQIKRMLNSIGISGNGIGISLGSISTQLNTTTPRYASGAVIPANFGEFKAILGDNKKEPEVVSPLSTIEQAVRNVMGDGNQRAVLEVDGVTFAELVYKYSNAENNRIGVSFVR